jgi:metal-sulfur cluster biosynthetic enzyme
MKKLSVEQQNALELLNKAINALSIVIDDEIDEILEDLGYLPERDLYEMGGELDFFLARGEICDREELLQHD